MKSVAVLNARTAIERRTHSLVVEQRTTRWGVVPQAAYADWWFDLRRKQLRIYGSLLRFIDQRIMRSETVEDLKQAVASLLTIPDMLKAYIHDVGEDVAKRLRGRRGFRVWADGSAEELK